MTVWNVFALLVMRQALEFGAGPRLKTRTPDFCMFYVRFFAVLLLISTISHGETVPVALRVEQNVRSELGKVVPFTRTQHRGLNVFVSNNSPEVRNLNVKYVIFGRDAVHHDIITISGGESPVTVKPAASEKVAITVATATEVRAHYDIKTKKKVESSGASIVGHGVQLLDAGKVIAETFDPPSLKQFWGKTILIQRR